MQLPSYDYQPVHILCASVFLSLMQITGAFMFRELSDIWPGSEPKGQRGNGGGGVGEAREEGVRSLQGHC